jgi:hypothetical protein
MGTNNPSEEQLELVEKRIIALADTCVDPGLPMESDSYFDEHGFDLESAAGQLASKIKAYCKNAEGLDPSLEDHPQVRRMARYLLENIEFDILEAPLSSELLQMKAKGGAISKSTGGGGAGGLSRIALLGAVAFFVLLVCVLAFVFMGGGVGTKAHMSHIHPAASGGPRLGKGRGWRNGSADRAI